MRESRAVLRRPVLDRQRRAHRRERQDRRGGARGAPAVASALFDTGRGAAIGRGGAHAACVVVSEATDGGGRGGAGACGGGEGVVKVAEHP